jgi:hypothetical protein
MAKRIPITDELKAAIKKSVGGDVKFDNLAVYEAIAVTSRRRLSSVGCTPAPRSSVT